MSGEIERFPSKSLREKFVWWGIGVFAFLSLAYANNNWATREFVDQRIQTMQASLDLGLEKERTARRDLQIEVMSELRNINNKVDALVVQGAQNTNLFEYMVKEIERGSSERNQIDNRVRSLELRK